MQALTALAVQKSTVDAAHRPVSGLPPTLSAKTLPQVAADGRVSQKSLKHGDLPRPFSANPNHIQGERPMSG